MHEGYVLTYKVVHYAVVEGTMDKWERKKERQILVGVCHDYETLELI